MWDSVTFDSPLSLPAYAGSVAFLKLIIDPACSIAFEERTLLHAMYSAKPERNWHKPRRFDILRSGLAR